MNVRLARGVVKEYRRVYMKIGQSVGLSVAHFDLVLRHFQVCASELPLDGWVIQLVLGWILI